MINPSVGAGIDTNNTIANNLLEKTAAGTFVSTTTEQTIALGQALGKLLQAGDVLVLTGDLGAGKTQLTKGIAVGMGVTDDVTSPTFTIEMVYEGTTMPLYHFDLYRFSYPEEWQDAGLDDFFSGNHVNLIEWAIQGGEFVPAPDLVITFSMQNGGRLCTVAAHSASGQRSLNLWQN